MRKRDELTDPRSCLNKARDDEWLFVLLGRDVAAVATVQFWISERIRLGKNKWDDPQIIEAWQWIGKVTNALLADTMPGAAQLEAVEPADAASAGLRGEQP